MKLYSNIILLILLLSVSSAYPLINGSIPGANSETYNANLINLTNNFFYPTFNVTQTFVASNGQRLLWVPWLDSSSACNVANIKTTFVNPASFTNNSQVTDEFSELGILMAWSNNETRFNSWHNTVMALDSPYGQLPCWVGSRNATAVRCEVNDTASDASARIALAYYYASNNINFAQANRTLYLGMANNLSRDHLIYEVLRINKSTSIPVGDKSIYYWVSGGTEGILNNGNTSNPYLWTGYSRDLIPWMLAAFNNTGNQSFYQAAEDYVQQFLLSVNYTGGTAKTSFKVAPFNYAWNFSANPPHILPGDTYYFNVSNTQWDDSDAPRALWACDSLRVANITLNGVLTGAFINLSDYCNAWSKTGTYIDSESTLQYYYNGTGSTTRRTGFYENGLGAGTHTYYNISGLAVKINETLSHYSWIVNHSYDGNACYGIYRGVRPAYALGVAIGFTDGAFGSNATAEVGVDPPIPPSEPVDDATTSCNQVVGGYGTFGDFWQIIVLGLVAAIVLGIIMMMDSSAVGQIVGGVLAIGEAGIIFMMMLIVIQGFC